MPIQLRRAIPGLHWLLALLTCTQTTRATLQINEIHYNPDVKTDLIEFIELFNSGPDTVALAGWSVTGGVDFKFPDAVQVLPGSYLVVAQNPTALRSKFGVTALGPWTGRLANEGDLIQIRDAAGRIVDQVEYGLGFPWPTVGDPPGYSIELVNPDLDNDLGGSWRVSVQGNPTSQNLTLIPDHAQWKFFRGYSEASDPTTLWRTPGFDDSTWETGGLPIGYGENFLATPLSDMQGNYTAVFLRKSFVVDNPAAPSALTLQAQYDDGFRVWINGTNVLTANLPPGEVRFNGTANSALENKEYVTFNLNAPAAYLKPGTNSIAVQAHNANLSSSSDFFFDLRLLTQLGPANRGPTPGARNSVWADNIPPQLRQVSHYPEQPRSAQPVTISVKATDPDGVTSVALDYQIVEPGQYIELTDPAYRANWVRIPMTDSGVAPDVRPGDSIFTAEIPASVQVHRRLIRYRITAADTTGHTITAPYSDDPQPNFAYFVYDGVPGWRGAARPGVTPIVDYSPAEMGRLPVYHLLSKKDSVERATWIEKYGGDLYKWTGTLVYDGHVYDHIHYRMRGGVWRYAMGKNMWKFDFNRGHDFQARDDWGRKFKTSWTKLNLGASIQQGDYLHRGEQGMFESVGFRLFNLAGVEAPRTAFVTFRIIDEANEANATNQFIGDFWGLYLAVEQLDGRFLDEHNLPDGNLYKMENGTGPAGADGELNNQGANSVSDYSDLLAFRAAYLNSTPTDTWWRQNLDLPRYYSYQAILQAIHHYDVCCGKNYFYYHNPDSNLWQVHPWDIDLTWADTMYVGGVTGGTEPFRSRLLSDFSSKPARPAFNREFANRVRELRDLLWNTNQTWLLIDEYAALVRGTNSPSILDADRSMWDYNPLMINSSIVNLSKAGQGRFYQQGTPAKNFAGLVQLMKNYVTYRASRILDPLTADPSVPAQPSLSGPPEYRINRISFRTSPFSSPVNSPFAAMQWRVGEVSPFPSPSEPPHYEIEPAWVTPELTNFQSEIQVPSSALKIGHSYRARVRMKDGDGRWSRWSAPLPFVVEDTDNDLALGELLRITEIMYNPPPGTDYEFIEFQCLGTPLDLSGIQFTEGIQFTFPPQTILPPGAFLVLTKAPPASWPAFRAYYNLDPSVPLLGPYSGSLNNEGERITLRTAQNGALIISLQYGDGRGWPTAADGAGHSLVPLKEALIYSLVSALDYPRNWRASSYSGGSPGRPDPTPPASLLINEFMAHTDYSDPARPEYDSNDWIEIFNPTTAPIPLSNWFLSDDPEQLKKWALPNLTLAPGSLISFDEVNHFHNPLSTGFGLDKAGERIFLSYLPGTSSNRVADATQFKGQENNISLGRFPDGNPYFVPMPPTRDATNAPPALSTVFSEIMYWPRPDLYSNPDDFEFVELYNPSTAPIPLYDTNGVWRLDGAVQFEFSDKPVLAPGAALLIVPFNPTNQTALTAFKQAYHLTNSSVPILGPYQGHLSNSGERLALERPLYPDLPGEPYAWAIVDEIIYSNQPPWPQLFVGLHFGYSLHRLRPIPAALDPALWIDSPPSPGNGQPPPFDGDNDGMPDQFERDWGLDPNWSHDAALDPDNDGASNLEEFLAGTHLYVKASRLALSIQIENNSIILQFDAVPNRTYSLQTRSQLVSGSWNVLQRIEPSPDLRRIRLTPTLQPGERAQFYRIATP